MTGAGLCGWVLRRIQPRNGSPSSSLRRADGTTLRVISSVTAIDGEVFVRRVRAMGIRDRPTSPHSPWQNGYAERLIGSIRRECIDHVIVFGERHLRHLLRSYLDYYNETRTHLSLDKDAPVSRSIEAVGRIFSRPVLGGLHHQYGRI